MSTDPTPAAMPSEGELFRTAMDTPSPTPSEPPPPSPPSTPSDDRPRDELGRFAPIGDAPAAAVTTPPPAPPPPPAPQEAPPDVPPAWRQREIMEALEQTNARNRQLEAAVLEMQRANAQLQGRIEPPKPPEVPDPITDPQGFASHVTQLINNERAQNAEQLRNLQANFSFQRAHDREGELFEHAYTTMVSLAERGDPSVVRQVLASPDPGNAMINWFKRARSLSTVGDDPDKYYQDRLAADAKDPKRAGEILELIRSMTAQATPPGAPPAVQLPPSLSRIPSTQSAMPGANGMPSDNELWNYAFRQGR